MSRFIDLRADYPLILTLFAPAYPRDLTWSYFHSLASARTSADPLFRGNQQIPVRIYIRFLCNFSSPYSPSVCESSLVSVSARAWCREFQFHSDMRLTPAVEHNCASLSRSTASGFPELAASSSAESAECKVTELTGYHAAFTSRPRRKDRIYSAGTEWRACSWQWQVRSIKEETSCLKAEEL